ncbi:hypothetical protein [Shewanella waksmanii]|uniref:hypothetical protein n=1 Tax=Shewanella waksmanii TaxID=213783 RepID=UPI00048B488E|nr:hypothetical protein [Shewanella waksmanii]
MNNSVLAALAISMSCIGHSVFAADKSIVASASELDIDVYEFEYDIATVTISGPNGYQNQLLIDTKEAELDFDKLGDLADGHYKYEIQYANNGGVEFITDSKTGRENAVRNLGKVEVKSGHFNVKDNEFLATTAENELISPSSNNANH